MSEGGTKVTESVSTVTIEEERRESRIFRKIVELWPLWLTVAGGLVACIKFWYTVTDLATAQARWQASSEQRREKTQVDMESIRTRIALIENNVSWIKDKK